MLKKYKFLMVFTIILFLFSSIFATCKDEPVGPEEPQGPLPPVFNISSIQTTFADGRPGILFRASSSVRVRLVQIVVTNPNNDARSYSPQGLIVQANEAFDLQEQNWAFFRWSGNWRFRFVGNHEPGGGAFDVTQTLNVAAKPMP